MLKRNEGIHDVLDNSHQESSADTPSIFQYSSLQQRARRDFADFKEWVNANPDAIAEHFELYEQHIAEIQSDTKFSKRLTRFFHRRVALDGKKEFYDYFGISNLGELPSNALVTLMESGKEQHASFSELANLKANSLEDIAGYISHYAPGIPEEATRQFGVRLQRLHGILPEFVLRDGGMEKTIRTAMGVVALAAAEKAEAMEGERLGHIIRAISPAYWYGATYPIIDDILHDSNYFSGNKKEYRNPILSGLSSGKDINNNQLPDHPITEELLRIYDEIRERFPFEEHRNLYYALESMYLAQDHDANRNISDITDEMDFYVPIMIKASLSRIVAHEFAGNDIGQERAARLLKTLLRQQFCDDQRDVVSDYNECRITPFTLYITNPDLEYGNPLFYRIAVEAYTAHRAYSHEESGSVSQALSYYGARDMAYTFSTDRAHAEIMQEKFGDDGGPVDQLIRAASGLGKRSLAYYDFVSPDKRIARELSNKIPERDPQLMDPRTYISDALSYVNEVLLKELDEGSPLEQVMRYALEAGGKRVRPALTLMLTESLQLPRQSVEPLLISTEFVHTASLLFDDLPAQDNASLRRGRDAAHIRFPEYDAQLAGISLIGQGIGILGRLGEYFPANKVNEVVEYTGSILGAKKLCLGQHMDLAANETATPEDIIEMYSLKTSTMIEGALVPLMMLAERPQVEIEKMQRYAYHAGIVFQLRDDILDVISSAEVMGKNGQQDYDKQNIVNALGVEVAQSMLDEHHHAAVQSLVDLPFPTDLLRELTTYFAIRKK